MLLISSSEISKSWFRRIYFLHKSENKQLTYFHCLSSGKGYVLLKTILEGKEMFWHCDLDSFLNYQFASQSIFDWIVSEMNVTLAIWLIPQHYCVWVQCINIHAYVGSTNIENLGSEYLSTGALSGGGGMFLDVNM